MSFWDGLFGKDPKDLFLSFDPLQATWSMVTWNFDLKTPSDRQWMVEIHRPERKELIQWTRSTTEDVTFYLDGKSVRRRRITAAQEDLRDLMNITIHSTIKSSLESHQQFMLEPVSGATTMDMQNEFRAMQWIQASFGMVTRALENMQDKKDLILTGAFFSGVEPETGDRVLRVMIFNLDIFFYFSSDQSLRVLVFDDKNMGHGEARNPSFQQIIKVTKPQFYDEIVKLVHRIALVGEIV